MREKGAKNPKTGFYEYKNQYFKMELEQLHFPKNQVYGNKLIFFLEDAVGN